MRVVGIALLANVGFAMGCDARDDCVRLGTDNSFDWRVAVHQFPSDARLATLDAITYTFKPCEKSVFVCPGISDLPE